MEQKVSINRMVRFVVQGNKPGETRIVPAVVTQVSDEAEEKVSLFVMDIYTTAHVHNAYHDEDKSVNSWHWPPRA